MLQLTVFLLAFTSIQGSRLLCQYYGDNPYIQSSTLASPSCDVLINTQGKIDESGKFSLKGNSQETTTLMRDVNCRNPHHQIYFGLNPCSNDAYLSISPQQYEKSVEEAMKWAQNSHYNGIFIDLCKINSGNKDKEKTVMDKVKSVSNDIKLPYGFILWDKPTDFDIGTHNNSADFIVVGANIYSLQRKPRYDALYNVTDIVDFWAAKGANVSKLIFNIEPYVVMDNSTFDMREMMSACDGQTQDKKDRIVDWMKEDVNKLAINANTTGIGGVFMSILDYDDFNGYCDSQTMLMTKTLRKKFH